MTRDHHSAAGAGGGNGGGGGGGSSSFSRKHHDDVIWREYDIHETSTAEDNVADSSEDPAEDAAATAFLFQTGDGGDDALEEMEFPLRTLSSTTNNHDKNGRGQPSVLRLTCQDDYAQSTGMAIWRGSEVLAEYLMHDPPIVQGKTVLELGAGVGLAGLVAHHLDASRVIWTDGDQTVLQNLRQNVQRNLMVRNDDTITPIVQDRCPQLIWGKQLEEFQKRYGQSEVLLGTDLFYMTKSLNPLFETIDKLLTTNGMFVTVNSCASQSSMSTVLKIASDYGLNCIQSMVPIKRVEKGKDDDATTRIIASYKEVTVDNDKDDYHDEQIYIFRRENYRTTVDEENG